MIERDSRVLRHKPHKRCPLGDARRGRFASKQNGPARLTDETSNRPEERGLAAAVWPDKGGDPAVAGKAPAAELVGWCWGGMRAVYERPAPRGRAPCLPESP